MKITGVRWAESSRRKVSHGEITFADKKAKKVAEKDFSDLGFRSTPQGGVVLPLDNIENRRMVEMCYKTHTTMVNPIIDWSTEEVWEFIHEYNLPYCCLYDQGWSRLGCIGCPMARGKEQEREFSRYPKYKALYLKAFEKMLANNKAKGVKSKMDWQTAEDVYEWWVSEKRSVDPDQMSIDEV